jgi:hypothetical protein
MSGVFVSIAQQANGARRALDPRCSEIVPLARSNTLLTCGG